MGRAVAVEEEGEEAVRERCSLETAGPEGEAEGVELGGKQWSARKKEEEEEEAGGGDGGGEVEGAGGLP